MQSKQYLMLFLEAQGVLLPVESINIVLALAALEKIPSPDRAFMGILNFHGKGLPVYDLLMLVDKEKQINITPDTHLIVGVVDSNEIGLIVSNTVELIEIESSFLQTPPSDAMPYVKFIYETPEAMAWGLDLTALVAYHQLQLQGTE